MTENSFSGLTNMQLFVVLVPLMVYGAIFILVAYLLLSSNQKCLIHGLVRLCQVGAADSITRNGRICRVDVSFWFYMRYRVQSCF